MTLVQVLVGMSLSTILMLGGVQFYANLNTFFRHNQQTIQQLDAGRTAFQYFSRDIQLCGYRGCRSQDNNYPLYRVYSELNEKFFFFRFDRPVFGFIAKLGTCCGNLPKSSCERIKLGSEVIVLYNVPKRFHSLAKAMKQKDSPLETKEGVNVFGNPLTLIEDCYQADVFIANKVEKNTVFHNEIMGENKAAQLSKSYGIEAKLSELQTVAFYLGLPERMEITHGKSTKIHNQKQTYSLFRHDVCHKAVEIIKGIKAIYFQYGFCAKEKESKKYLYRSSQEIKDHEWPFVLSVKVKLTTENDAIFEYEFELRNGINPNFYGYYSGSVISYINPYAVTS